MESKAGVGISISLTIVALIIGLIGVAVLIAAGEATNNDVVAFVAVSIPFALLAGFFSWIAPRAKWFIAIAITAPVAILSFLGAWSGAYLMLGAIWTVAISFLGAHLGGRLRLSRLS
jgi:hypothetical protein